MPKIKRNMSANRPIQKSRSHIVNEPAILVAFEFSTPEASHEFSSELVDYLARLRAERLTNSTYVVTSDASPLNVILETMTVIARGNIRAFGFPISKWSSSEAVESSHWLTVRVGNALR